ncbi:MAG: DUF58 domain-containing protein [Pontibacterium sp.]
MAFFAALRTRLSQPFYRWAAKRRPRGRSIELNQKRIFIFPGRAGWGFLAICALLLLIAMNYENNLIHAIAFLLLSLFVLSILHTYSNLAGIKVQAVKADACFVGEQAGFELRLSAKGRRIRENIQLAWKGCPAQTVNRVGQSAYKTVLFHPALNRGRLIARPLLLETYYPLGLLRAWSWVEMDLETLVYPAPLHHPTPPASYHRQGQTLSGGREGGDDFTGLEAYQPGMSLRHIAWKAYARGQGLHAKTFLEAQDDHIWLDWDTLSGLNTEERLSVLCHQVLQMHRRAEPYGLRLPGCIIEPDRGEKHRQRLLRELALFSGGQV